MTTATGSSIASSSDTCPNNARHEWFPAALLVAFATFRLIASLGNRIVVQPDTASFFDFRIWGGLRFPVVASMYSIVGNHRAIVSLQAVIGVVCWSAAALIAGSLLERRVVRYAFEAGLLALGLTWQVANWDSVLMSESISISLTVVFSALALRFVCRPTSRTGIAVFVVGALWGMTRQNNAAMLALAACLIALVGLRRDARRVALWVAGGFLVVAAFGMALASSTPFIQRYNTAEIYVRRVVSDADRRPWFEAHGMPSNGTSLIAGPGPPAPGEPDPASALMADHRFGPWMRRHGPDVYLRYLVTNPMYLVVMPFTSDGALPAVATGVGYGTSRRVLSYNVERVLWPKNGSEQRSVVLFVVGVGLAAAWFAVRSAARRRSIAGAAGVLILAAANVAFVTHSAGWEYERLLMSTSVSVRIAILWLIAMLADETISRRSAVRTSIIGNDVGTEGLAQSRGVPEATPPHGDSS